MSARHDAPSQPTDVKAQRKKTTKVLPLELNALGMTRQFNIPLAVVTVIIVSAIALVIAVTVKYSRYKKSTRHYGKRMMEKATPATIQPCLSPPPTSASSAAALLRYTNTPPIHALNVDPCQVYDFWMQRFSAISPTALNTFHDFMSRHTQ